MRIFKIKRGAKAQRRLWGIIIPLCLCISVSQLFTACTPTPQNVTRTDAAAPIYPDYRDVTIPRNIAPLNFLLRAEGCEALEVSIRRTARGPGVPATTAASAAMAKKRR